MGSTTQPHQHIKWFSLIRILGLLMVLGYHFFKVGYPGGFVGVDIFFVFSGFLITSLMIDEFADTQRFDLLAFLRRRFYRIVPAVVLMILITVPFTLLVSPDLITGLGKQIAAALGFVTNWFEMMTGGSYENSFIPHLFVHTWFLGVEMQFYLVWGLIVFAISRALRDPERPMRQRRIEFRGTLFALAAVLAAGSLMLMWWQSRGLKDFTPVYFSSLTRHVRAWQASFALVLAALATLWLGVVVRFDAQRTYPGALLIVALLAAVMIVAARLLHEATPQRQEPWVLQQLAGLSYGIYLYHWPLYVIFSRLWPQPQAIIATVVLSLMFAILSGAVVEPLVAGKPVRWLKARWAKRLLTATVSLGCVALAGVALHQVIAAPTLSALETSLWTAGLQQDVAQYDQAQPVIEAAHTPAQTAQAARLADARQAAKAASKRDPQGYEAKNRNSTAAAHSIPAGVTIIGDSVTLGPASYLRTHLANAAVDAEGDRTMSQALTLINQQKAAGTLREFVVIACGTNSLDDYASVLNQMIAAIKPGHKLIFVTPHDGRAKPDWNSSKLTVLERGLSARYNWITIADWARVAEAHPELFKGTDGVHFAGRQEGSVLFSQTINAALIAAAKKPAKK